MENGFEVPEYVEAREDDRRRKKRGFWLFGGRGAVMALGLAAVVAIAAVTATLTDALTVSNTYTFGNVSISLKEQKSAPDYIAPGAEIKRSSEIKNTGELPAYVFLKVEMPKDGGDKLFSDPTVDTGWTCIATEDDSNFVKYVYAYGNESKLTPLEKNSIATQSSTVTYAQSHTNNNRSQATIKVTAYAIQTTDVVTGNGTAASSASDFWNLVKTATPRTGANS